jgi:peptidylprolyl isomerase
MMHLFSIFSLVALSLSTSFVCAEEPSLQENSKKAATETQEAFDIAKVSEAFGHLIGKNIETLGVKFDVLQIVKGLQDAIHGKESPMTELECVQAISSAQEGLFKKQASENLKKAEEFLSKQVAEEGMTVTEGGKLHYKIEKAGEGSEIEAHSSPLVRYTGKFLDGSVFGTSKEDELIPLDETIPGLTKGMIGMKEGEKRTLYIHPELAYGTSGSLPPNSLLTFEIECIKANASRVEELESITTNSSGKPKAHAEIATPATPEEALR